MVKESNRGKGTIKKIVLFLRNVRYLRIVIVLFVVLCFGAGLHYSYNFMLDYSTNRYDEKSEGYEFVKPDFLQLTKEVPILVKNCPRRYKTAVNSDYANYLEASWQARLRGDTSVFPANHPAFSLGNIDGKQTAYQVVADLSSVKNIQSVLFPTWGEKDGKNDFHVYDGKYDSAMHIWKSDFFIKDHRESGKYHTDLVIIKKSGKVEHLNLGEFTIDAPIVKAEVDTSKTDKGQLDVTLQPDCAADVEKITVPIWLKKDKSDMKTYEAHRQQDGSYKVHMDYEEFNYENGTYKINASLQSANGLTAKKDVGTAEIQLSTPVRIRVLSSMPLYKDRQMTDVIKELKPNSMSYIKGIVYNGDQKIYRTKEGYFSAEKFSVSEMLHDIHYVAHRGNHDLAPENSLPAFQLADTWGIETDIHVTKDGQWVVMHDSTVDRMTNGSGSIQDMTLAEISNLCIAAGANVSSYTDEQLHVPTLEEFLAIAGQRQKVPFIEIKAENVPSAAFDKLASLIAQYGLAEKSVVISFNFNNLAEIKKRLPNQHVQLLSKNIDLQLIQQAKSLGIRSGIDIDFKRARKKVDLITEAQAQGLSVNLWNVPRKDFSKAKSLGIDYLTSDPS